MSHRRRPAPSRRAPRPRARRQPRRRTDNRVAVIDDRVASTRRSTVRRPTRVGARDRPRLDRDRPGSLADSRPIGVAAGVGDRVDARRAITPGPVLAQAPVDETVSIPDHRRAQRRGDDRVGGARRGVIVGAIIRIVRAAAASASAAAIATPDSRRCPSSEVAAVRLPDEYPGVGRSPPAAARDAGEVGDVPIAVPPDRRVAARSTSGSRLDRAHHRTDLPRDHENLPPAVRRDRRGDRHRRLRRSRRMGRARVRASDRAARRRRPARPRTPRPGGVEVRQPDVRDRARRSASAAGCRAKCAEPAIDARLAAPAAVEPQPR